MEAEAIVAIGGTAVTVLGSIGAGAKWFFGKIVDFVEKRETDCEEKIEALSKRLDQCHDQHVASGQFMAEMAERIGDRGLASRARSMSPPEPMPVLSKTHERIRETWGDIE